ncbi:MAG: carotenoid 1,2-hydratase [Polyangiaceae bacterium]
MSDDGATSIVVIALLGNPFSPRYALARSVSSASSHALDFCALNVAIYGKNGSIWSLSERAIGDGDRGARSVGIGRSRMEWQGDDLVVIIDERSAPLGKPVRGKIRFSPTSSSENAIALDAGGNHTWWPIAPSGRIAVELDAPTLRFTGHGYHDANAGAAPLEDSFHSWSWCRARIDATRSCVTYDVDPKHGPPRSFALDFQGDRVTTHNGSHLRRAPIERTGWRIDREARTEGAHVPRVVRSLEDTPFYARALVETQLGGRRTIAMHETLSLDRFSRRWVRFLLGFRMACG